MLFRSDCPGSDDFVGGAITALNVTDQAVVLINGQYGPEVGTQNNFRYTEKLKKPVIFLVNQLDSDKCDFDNIISTMQEIYGPKCVQIQYPISTGPGFNSLIDVLLMKKYSWKPEGGAPIIEDIPAEEMDKAMELHKALVEAAAENDEGLMEKFFEEETLTEDELREGIRKGLVTRSIFPVFCVCAGKDMGVRRLMEFLGNVVPFVSEMPKVHNTRGEEVAADSDGPTSLYFFKTGMEPHIGEVSYFKVMSGKVKGSICSLWAVVSFSMCGATYPVEAMDRMVHAMAVLFPLRHYIVIYQINIFDGFPLQYTSWNFAALLFFILLPVLSAGRIKKNMLQSVYIP